MFERFWIVFKEFLTNHNQHIWLEKTLTILDITAGAAVLVLVVLFYIRLLKYIKNANKHIKKISKSSNKNILNFLKKKKNTTF